MSDESKPAVIPDTTTVSIKSFPEKVYADARAAAKNARMTMGEWAAIAFRERIERESGAVVFPPAPSNSTTVVEYGTLPNWEKPAPLALSDWPEPPPPAPPPLDMSGLAQVLSAVALATSRSDKPIPAALINDTVAATRAHLRQMRGLPPLKPRTPRTPRYPKIPHE